MPINAGKPTTLEDAGEVIREGGTANEHDNKRRLLKSLRSALATTKNEVILLRLALGQAMAREKLLSDAVRTATTNFVREGGNLDGL